MNIGWIFSWHYEVTWLSMIFMLGLLLSLIIITLKLSPSNIEYATDMQSVPFLVKICIYGFDIYLGWIVAATIANMSVLLVKMNWNRFGLSEEFWTVIVLAVGAIIGMLFIITRQKYLTSLAIIWAYCGILIKHISPSGYGGSHPIIITVTILGMFMILATGVVMTLMKMGDVG